MSATHLVVLAAGPYYLVYRLARWLFPWIEEMTRDVTLERSVLAYNLAGAAVIVILLVMIRTVFDFARISTVVEGRHSMFLAAIRGLRFVLGNPLRVLLLVLVVAVLGAGLLSIYALISPGAGQTTVAGVVWALCVGQTYILARLWLRLSLVSSELALDAPSHTSATDS